MQTTRQDSEHSRELDTGEVGALRRELCNQVRVEVNAPTRPRICRE